MCSSGRLSERSPSATAPATVLTVYALNDEVPHAEPVRPINWDFPMLQPPTIKPVNEWATGLFRCGDHCVPNCCLSFLCPCVALAQIFARMGMPRYWGMLLVMAWAWLAMVAAAFVFIIPMASVHVDDLSRPPSKERHLSGLVLPVVVLWGGNALAVVVIRRTIRRTFNIHGLGCGDCAAAWCCTPCAIAQAATHLQSYTPGTCSFQRPDVLPAFVES